MIIQIEVPNGTNSVKVISCEKVITSKACMTVKNTRTVAYEYDELDKLIVKGERE